MNDLIPPSKHCTKCSKELPATLEYFHRHKGMSDGLRPDCKECAKVRRIKAQLSGKKSEWDRAYRQKHETSLKARKREYYEKHHEEIRAKAKRWREEHLAEKAEADRAYRIKNKEKVRARKRAWAAANPEHVRRKKREWQINNKERVNVSRRKTYRKYIQRYRESARRWQKTEQARAGRYARYHRDPETARAKARHHYWRNPERCRERRRRYGANNRDKVKIQRQIWYRTGAGIVAVQRRNARKRSLPNTLTTQQWQRCLKYWHHRCAVCDRPIGLWHTLAADHWIPLSNGSCPGTVPGNIIPLCHGIDGCNNSKSSRDPVVWLTEKFGKRKSAQILARVTAYFEWVQAQEDQATSLRASRSTPEPSGD